MIDIDYLERLARAASQGPRGQGDSPRYFHEVAEAGTNPADRDFQAAASPDVVLELIAMVRTAGHKTTVTPRDLLPTERECCGTFPRTPHRSTCKHYRGKFTPYAAAPKPDGDIGMSCTADWLEKRLAVADDSMVSAGRPCDGPQGCNARNCLGCGEPKPEGE